MTEDFNAGQWLTVSLDEYQARPVIFKSLHRTGDARFRACWGCRWLTPGDCTRPNDDFLCHREPENLDRVWVASGGQP